jgi:hypothetical protein
MEGAGEKMRICAPDSWGSNFFGTVTTAETLIATLGKVTG